MKARNLALTAALAILGLSSCAEQREPINRIQANALDKSFFVGNLEDPGDDPVFLTRAFVVDASESQELVGVSIASGVERIRWEISEEMLFARRAYSVTQGDDKGVSKEPNGDIIAAFPIVSHFDARRAYNPNTGEELDVFEEITTDRPWYARQQFRVDWSKNLVNTPAWTTMFFGTTLGDIKLTPIAYYDSDERSKDALAIEPEDGYLDVTSHFLVEPQMLDLGSFKAPLCWLMGVLTGSAIYSCDPQEAVVRTSFWRLDRADPDGDFEPFINTQAPQEIFGNPGGIGDSASTGIVTPPHETYDPGYGYTDEGVRRYMNLHNIWEQSHQTRGQCSSNKECRELTGQRASTCLPSGTCTIPCDYETRADRDDNGTDDACENKDTNYKGSRGSQCSARNRCTIPYRDRETRVVPYYMNAQMPDDLQDEVSRSGKLEARGASEDVIYTWNQALKQAVARARTVECQRTKSDGDPASIAAECHRKYFHEDTMEMVSYGGWGLTKPKDDDDILVACHNPVRDYDHPACGEPGFAAREGDIRRNFLIYWPYSTHAPYGGIGNWRADPVTGQIVGAAATTIGRSATRSAAQVRDIMMVALGELELQDITDGVPARLYERALRDGRAPTTYTGEELERRVSSLRLDHLAQTVNLGLTNLVDPGELERDPTRALMRIKAKTVIDPSATGKQLLELQALTKPLQGTALEAQLVNSNSLIALGVNPNSSVSEALLDRVSPLRGQELAQLTEYDRRMVHTLGLRGICFVDQAVSVGNPDIASLARYFQEKYSDLAGHELAEAIYDDLWKETYKGIQLHEVGHSLGLLHNFTSSYDSLNYNPQYWQLRTHHGESTESCNGAPRGGDVLDVASDTCMGPRYLDPETDDELGRAEESRPGIHYFGHTSTMEYQNARFFETVGLGQYDVMAMGALYGRALETFDPQEFSAPEQELFEELHLSQRIEDLYTGAGQVHYTELARMTRVFDPSRCREATDEEKSWAEWRIVHNKVCAPPPKGYAHWDDFVDSSQLTNDDQVVARKLRVRNDARVGASSVRWPYRFGGDQMNGYLHVNPFDSGADPYEVTVETIRKNNYNYPFTYFRGKRRGWTDFGLPSYTARMFYERLRSYHWGISFTNAFYMDIAREDPRFENAINSLLNNDNQLRPHIMAMNEMFNAISGVFLRPEPGDYVFSDAEGVYNLPSVLSNEVPQFSLDASQGRFMAPSFDSGPAAGGSWNYHDFVERAGFDVEKALAARALTDGRSVFFSISRDSYLDSRNVNINFRNDMPHAVDRLLGGVLSESWDTVAPYILDPDAPELKIRDLTDPEPQPLPAGAYEVFPNLGYNQHIPTLLWAHLFGRRNGDLELTNKLRVWLQGSISGELDVPEAEQIRFSDPESGITYVARLFGPETLYEREVDRGIGSRMLRRANELLAATYEVATDDEGAPRVDEFGRPVLELDETGRQILSSDRTARQRLRAYVGLLDATVQISTLVGHGPFNVF